MTFRDISDKNDSNLCGEELEEKTAPRFGKASVSSWNCSQTCFCFFCESVVDEKPKAGLWGLSLASPFPAYVLANDLVQFLPGPFEPSVQFGLVLRPMEV